MSFLARPDERAIEDLEQCLKRGFRNFEAIARDSDLDSVRGDPRFAELLKEYAREDGAQPKDDMASEQKTCENGVSEPCSRT